MTIQEASKYLGLPVAQLKSWAAQRAVGFNQAGPEYGGTYEKPIYSENMLNKWKATHKHIVISQPSV